MKRIIASILIVVVLATSVLAVSASASISTGDWIPVTDELRSILKREAANGANGYANCFIEGYDLPVMIVRYDGGIYKLFSHCTNRYLGKISKPNCCPCISVTTGFQLVLVYGSESDREFEWVYYDAHIIRTVQMSSKEINPSVANNAIEFEPIPVEAA